MFVLLCDTTVLPTESATASASTDPADCSPITVTRRLFIDRIAVVL